MQPSIAVLLVVASAQPQLAFAQNAAPAPAATSETATVLGRVSTDEGAPVGRARVAVLTGGRSSDPVLTDSDGRFGVRAPLSGDYSVTVTKAGFVRAVVEGPPEPSDPLEVRLTRGAVVSGRVFDPSGRPVVSIRVRASLVDRGPQEPVTSVETETNDLGEFRIGSLAPGRYEIATDGRPETPSILPPLDESALPQGVRSPRMVRSSDPTSDALVAETRAGVETGVRLAYQGPAVSMPYAEVGGAVTGVLVDEAGDPAEGLSVQLWQMRFMNGVRVLQPFGPKRATDDRGRYRFYHVPAGRYVVAATDESWSTEGARTDPWLPVYYPGRTAHLQALPLRVDRSQEVSGIDMVFTRGRGARVFGYAIDADGQPARCVAARCVSLVAAYRPGSATVPARIGAVNADGTFEFLNVPPGEYIVGGAGGVTGTLLILSLDRPLTIATQPVRVNGADVGPIELQTSPTATITGRVVFEGTRPPEDVTFAIRALAANPGLPSGMVGGASIDKSDWTFQMSGIHGPIRIALTSAPAGWWLKKANIGPTNAAQNPVTFPTGAYSLDGATIVLADTAGTVTGQVVDEQGAPATDYWAIVFAVDRDRWFFGSPYVRNAVPDIDGHFTIPSLPPGDYWVAAADAIEGDSVSGEWQSVELLDRLVPSARRVTVNERERVATELPLVRITR
jgi:hypothetical protein